MRKRERTVIVILILLTLFLSGASLCIGSFPLANEDIRRALTGRLAADSLAYRVFWNLRFARTCMALAAGMALGLSGAVYQTVFRNPLASPDLTGVASGASFGAAAAIVLGAGSTLEIMNGAFFMGVLTLVFVLALVKMSGEGHAGSYILAGIIVSALAEAGLMILKTLADPERELAAVEFWTMGSLAGITWSKLFPNLWFILVPLVLLLAMARQVYMLSADEEQARTMGLNPKKWRLLFLGLTTLMIASMVSLTGVIAFVGLTAPHIAYFLLRKRGRGFLLTGALCGGSVTVLADIFARSIGTAELPLSVMTVVLAVPVLAVLLCRRAPRRGGDWQ